MKENDTLHLIVREAGLGDAAGLAAVLSDLVAAGKRRKSDSPEFVLGHYITHAHQIQCAVASEDGTDVLGFQSLKSAWVGNPYEVSVGWGIIGTHIRPSAARRGVGRALFRETLKAAREHGLDAIDATIGNSNTEGLGYYEAMGFQTYRHLDGAVSKVFRIR